MNRSRVTILELSKTLGLSTCTVSRVLNRSFAGFTYSKETVRRVTECEAKMGYVPNAQAKGLRTNKTMLIGFLLPSAQVGVFGSLTHRIELELRRRGYQLLITHSQYDVETEKELIRTLLARGIDGLIWIPTQMKIRPEEVGLRLPFPVVIVDRPRCTSRVPFVATDNRAASRMLAERILACGHGEITVVNASRDDRSMQERLEGIADVYGSRIELLDIANDAAVARKEVIQRLHGKSRPSVIVALSETLTIGVLSALRELNLSIPRELSFASFDAFPLADHWTPPITLIRQDVDQVAQASVDLLLKYIASPSSAVKNVRIPATLEWRESVVPRLESGEVTRTDTGQTSSASRTAPGRRGQRSLIRT